MQGRPHSEPSEVEEIIDFEAELDDMLEDVVEEVLEVESDSGGAVEGSLVVLQARQPEMRPVLLQPMWR